MNLDEVTPLIQEMFSDAWSIKIEGSEYLGDIQGEQAGGWEVTFSCKVGGRGRYSAWSKLLPNAIKKAALKAKADWS